LTVDRFEHVKLDAEAGYDAVSSRVRLSSFNASTPWSRLRGQGDLALTPAAGQSTAKIIADSLDLERLSVLFKLPVRIASTASAAVDAHWKAMDFEAAAVDAAAKLAASRPPAKDTIPIDASLHATVRGNQIVADL